MKITYRSVTVLSITDIEGVEIGCAIDTKSEGIQPTYGMTADDMGFQTFFMTVKWGDL